MCAQGEGSVQLLIQVEVTEAWPHVPLPISPAIHIYKGYMSQAGV
jgi:hypothetical protein